MKVWARVVLLGQSRDKLSPRNFIRTSSKIYYLPPIGKGMGNP